LSGIGRTKLYDLIRDGVLPTVRIGRRRLVRPDTMRRVLADLERTGIEQRRAG
jgi:excisionase family DNA binding protein